MKKLDPKEITALIGLCLFVGGIAKLSIAAAMMVAGAMLFLWAYMTSIPPRPKSSDDGKTEEQVPTN
jgi:hypothetical protein